MRATAVDAVQNGFRPMVVREAVGDRSASAHEQSLFDLNAKYADVVKCAEILAFFDGLPEGLFELQKQLPRPALPSTIGVVTAEGGAARRDLLAHVVPVDRSHVEPVEKGERRRDALLLVIE